MLYLLNPINGVKEETNYKLLEKITGTRKETLMSLKSKKKKVSRLNYYLIDDETTKEEIYSFMCKEIIKDEIWKEITKDKIIYKVSDYGRFKRKYKNGKEKLLRPFIHKNHNKFLVIKLFGKEKSVHSIVADMFLEVPKDKLKYHLDGDIYNNRATNIGFCTRKELGLKFASLSKSIPVIKLDPITLEELDYYENETVAGKNNFICKEAIRQAVNGKQKTAAGFKWKIDEEFYNKEK